MSIKNLTEIESSLGLPAGEFKKLYESKEEKEIPLSDFEILKKNDYEARINNIKTESGNAALEIAIKNARAKYGLEFTGKNIENFAEALKIKAIADAKIEPVKQVEELKADLEKLRTNSLEWEKKHNELLEVTANEKKRFKIESEIISNLPKVKTKIPLQDMKILFELKYKPALDDKGSILLHDETGAVLKNSKSLNPMTLPEVMKGFESQYIEAASGGSGGGDNTGLGKDGSYSAFVKEMGLKGINEGTKVFVDEMKVRIKVGTLKM